MRYLLTLSFAILFGIGSNTALARGFDDTDIYPFFKDIVFSKRALGFPASRHYSRMGPFLLERDARVLRDVGLLEFGQAFPDWREQSKLAAERHGFITKDAYCSEGGVGHDQKLFKENKLIPVPIDICNSISALQVIGDQLWLGTLRQGEGFEYAAEGVVVLSLDDWHHLGTVKVPGAVSTLRADPYSDDVWVATQLGLFKINRRLELVSKQYFYYDFEPSTGRASLFLVPSARKSNLLAVIAWGFHLGETDQRAFYEATKSIPKETIENFPLYAYVMSGKGFPQEWNALVPFYIQAAQSTPANMRAGDYMRLCRFDDKRVADFLLEESHHYHTKEASAALVHCLNRYGLAKESEQAERRLADLRERKRVEEADQQFASLTGDYFIELRRDVYEAHYRTMNQLCSLLVRNPDYIERLVALFTERGIDTRRDGNFFGNCLRWNMGEPGFEQFLPLVGEVLQSTKSLLFLSSGCEALRRMRQDYLSDMVIPILYARRTTYQAMRKYQSAAINPNVGFYVSCANASVWVMDREERVDQLLAEIGDHPEIQDTAFKTLHDLTGQNFHKISDWQNWWRTHRKLGHRYYPMAR